VYTDQSGLVPGIDATELARVCRAYHVRRLDLFGSALTDRFEAARSDLDFVVAFEDVPLRAFSRIWFGFQEALEGLAGRKVDLVDERAIRNPYFRREVEATRCQVFPPP
jgi:predicted nucleotidyltransferase